MARIAIVGCGISGLGAAYLLHKRHDISVYEKSDHIGGHARTLSVNHDGQSIAVDTGFIVFNQKNYPHLWALFEHLDVPIHKSDMTFAASIREGWLEWGAKDLNTIFGQRRNLLRPKFAALVRDVLRFNAIAEDFVELHPDLTLGGMIDRLEMSDWFRRYYLLPMTSAIWSCPPCEMMRFPARTLIRFFANHHLLSASGQPQWYTVTGGAKEYVSRLTQGFSNRIRTNSAVTKVVRTSQGINVWDVHGAVDRFDHIIFASHADETRLLLSDATDDERLALSAFRYQKNTAVLHRDDSVMPRSKRCWASWVYSSDGNLDDPKLSVTYWMNLLQAIPARAPLFVTLNPRTPLAQEKVYDVFCFDHPVFDHQAVAAQQRLQAMQGMRNTWYCGAHLRHGFHEDGLASAVRVAELMGIDVPWALPQPAMPVTPRQPLRPRRPILAGAKTR